MNKLMGKVFTWMTIGLLLTFGVGYFVSTNEVMYENVYNTAWYIGFAIAELVLVIFLAARVMKMYVYSLFNYQWFNIFINICLL